MSHLDITLLGSPVISIDGKTVNNRTDKIVALVALLALQGPTLHRDVLVSSLWSGSQVSKGQAALRTAIWRLKDARLTPWLEIEREFITLDKGQNIWIDIDEFRQNLEKSRQYPHLPDSSCQTCAPLLNRAVELYRGDFMAGYSPRNAAGFDEWRAQFSQLLRDDYLNSLERLVKGYIKRGEYSQALPIARRWVAIDPYNEEAHSLVIRIYALIGQRANAIAHYRSIKRLVEKKLDISLSNEITATYKNILTGKNPPVNPAEKLKNPALLLFDINNISELLAKDENKTTQALVRFSQVIKDGIRRCGGRLIQQTGDSFAILFDHGQPLQCAIMLQRTVAETRWETPDPFALRMAITVIPKNQTMYPEYSAELLACRQLLQTAAGDHILITEQATRELEFPISSHAHYLGRYFVPGQANPTQIFALVHQYLHSIPHLGLQNLVRSPAELPTQSTHFVGRETELARLSQLLAQPECRLLTLVGPGGVGKTRLGIEAASRLQGNRPESIYYVSLVTHRNPSTLFTPISEALNLSFNNPGDQAVQLVDHLRSKQMLLLLDNFEHLLAAKSYLIKLLEAAPGLRLMITSRERLNLHMETVFDVAGLPYPTDPDDPKFEQHSAVQLFIQNARRVSPGFSVRPEEKFHVIRICDLVDGLPLGIELASAWVRAFSCQEIADSLRANLDFARTSSTDVPHRHRSLRAAFDHSWKLLSEESRRDIRKLSVFRNGFTSQAAQYVANANPLVLASYVDKSLLTRQYSGRYEMPETLRAFVREMLVSDAHEYESVMRLFSEYYGEFLGDMVAQFSGENGVSAIEAVKQETGNVRDAVTHAIQQQNWPVVSRVINPIFTYFEMVGRFRDGRDIAQAMRSSIENLVAVQQPALSYSLLGWEGWFSFRLGFTQEGLQNLHRTLEFTQTQGQPIDIAYTLLLLADAYRSIGQLGEAKKIIDQCLHMMTYSGALEVPHILAVFGYALTIYGLILVSMHAYDQARQVIDQSQAALIKSKSRYGLIRLYDVQAHLAVAGGQYAESRQLRLQALEIAEQFGDRHSVAFLMNNLCDSVQPMGDINLAFFYLKQAVQLSDEIGDRRLAAVSNNNMGFYTLIDGHPDQAIPYYLKSLAMFHELGNPDGVFFTLRDTARAYILAGMNIPARSYLAEALRIGPTLANSEFVLHLLPVLARFFIQLNQPDRAAQLCSITLNRPNTEPDLQQEARQLLGELPGHLQSNTISAPAVVAALPTFQELLAEIEKI